MKLVGQVLTLGICSTGMQFDLEDFSNLSPFTAKRWKASGPSRVKPGVLETFLIT